MKTVIPIWISRQAADVLLEEILRREDGEFLGSEEELEQRLGISKPSLRQAARVLEYQQLLVSKRGRYGGYYGRRPDTQGVMHLAGILLRHRDVSRLQCAIVTCLLYLEAVKGAVECEDEKLRSRLEVMVLSSENHELDLSSKQQYEDNVAFFHLLGEMSGNPLIEIFLDVILEYTKFPNYVDRRPTAEQYVQHRKARWELGNCILKHDKRAALRTARGYAADLVRWAQESEGVIGK